MALNLSVLSRTLCVHGEYGDTCPIGCLNRRPNGESVTRHKHDGGHILGNEILYLV